MDVRLVSLCLDGCLECALIGYGRINPGIGLFIFYYNTRLYAELLHHLLSIPDGHRADRKHEMDKTSLQLRKEICVPECNPATSQTGSSVLTAGSHMHISREDGRAVTVAHRSVLGS
jgi:hypothetical protein